MTIQQLLANATTQVLRQRRSQLPTLRRRRPRGAQLLEAPTLGAAAAEPLALGSGPVTWPVHVGHLEVHNGAHLHCLYMFVC